MLMILRPVQESLRTADLLLSCGIQQGYSTLSGTVRQQPASIHPAAQLPGRTQIAVIQYGLRSGGFLNDIGRKRKMRAAQDNRIDRASADGSKTVPHILLQLRIMQTALLNIGYDVRARQRNNVRILRILCHQPGELLPPQCNRRRVPRCLRWSYWALFAASFAYACAIVPL